MTKQEDNDEDGQTQAEIITAKMSESTLNPKHPHQDKLNNFVRVYQMMEETEEYQELLQKRRNEKISAEEFTEERNRMLIKIGDELEAKLEQEEG